MKKFFRRLFRFLVIILIVGVILGIAGSLIFRNQIGSRLISSFNNQITTSFTYDAISLNVFQNFPKARTELSGVLIEDVEGDTLLSARNMTFMISIFDLIQSKYEIENVEMEKAQLFWKIDESGKANYKIFKETSPDDDPQININKGKIKSLQLFLENLQYDHSGLVDINNMTLEGAFAGNELNVATDAQLTSRFIEIQGQRFLQNEAISFKAPLEINPTDKVFEFKNAELLINDNQFRVNGDFQSWENGNYMDIFINSEDSKLEGVVGLLPDNYTGQFGTIKSDKNISFSAWIKGILGRVERPEIKAELKMEDSQLSFSKINATIDSTDMVVLFKNGELRNMESAVFEVRNLSGFINDNPLRLNAMLDNLDNPNLHITFDGRLPFEIVYPYFQDELFEVEKGDLIFNSFTLKGRYENMIDPSLVTLVESNGKILVDSFMLRSENDSISISKGTIDIDGNKMVVSDFQFEGFDSEFGIEAVLFNSLPVLLADKDNSELAELEFDVSLDAPRLNISQMLSTFNLISASLPDSLQNDSLLMDVDYEALQDRRERLTSFLKGNIKIKIDSLLFNNLKASKVEGVGEVVNSDLQLNGSAQVFGGNTTIESQLRVERQSQLEVSIDMQNVKATQFLEQTNQLHQTVLKSEHISGTLNTKVVMQAFWNEKDEFIEKKLRVRGLVNLQDGQLKAFPIWTNFADQINAKTIQELAFTNWQSYLEVRRGKVFFPLTIIKGNNLNLIASTEHQFQGKYRYNVQLNARSGLAKTIADNNPSITPARSNSENYYNYYFTLFGKQADDFEWRESSKAVKADFERSKIRGREIDQVLQQSFSTLNTIDYQSIWEDKPLIKEEIIIPEQPIKEEKLPEIKIPPIDTVKNDTTSQ